MLSSSPSSTRSKSARERFYEYANWCYQLGVFKRSRGKARGDDGFVVWPDGSRHALEPDEWVTCAADDCADSDDESPAHDKGAEKRSAR